MIDRKLEVTLHADVYPIFLGKVWKILSRKTKTKLLSQCFRELGFVGKTQLDPDLLRKWAAEEEPP
jgi:hypothetical protein